MRRGELGMTLLEILIVLAILALVMGLVIGPRVLAGWRQARIQTTRLQVYDLAYAAFPAWQIEHATTPCPADLEEVARYTNGRKTHDVWGTALAMRCGDSAPADEEFGALSAGPDEREETPDDIRSWDRATHEAARP